MIIYIVHLKPKKDGKRAETFFIFGGKPPKI